MNERTPEDRVVQLAGSADAGEPLSYAVELWDVAGEGPERVLGRAASILLANAVFAAAQTDYRGRKLVLKRGDKVLAESA
jgi:hypothetical protein